MYQKGLLSQGESLESNIVRRKENRGIGWVAEGYKPWHGSESEFRAQNQWSLAHPVCNWHPELRKATVFLLVEMFVKICHHSNRKLINTYSKIV